MIEVGRNSIIIRNVDFESKEYKRFESAFSLYDTVAHKYSYNIYKIIDSDIHIPATISPSIIQTYFTNDVISYNYSKVAQAGEISFANKHGPRDDLQQAALKFLSSIKNDYNERWRMLNLKTGSGKTFVTITTIGALKQKAFIVVDTTDLAIQWKKEFLFHTTLTEDQICILSGRESVEEAKTNENYKIFIAIQNTLNMLLDDDLNAINSLMHKLKIGVRVFDECHVNFHSTCMINALSDVNYTIFLTATPQRSDFKENILYGKVYDRVPAFTGLSKLPYHKIVLMNFNSKPNEKQKLSVKTKYGFSMARWANILATDSCYENYKTSLFKILDAFKLIENNKKVAIMLPTIDLIDKTYTDLTLKYPNIEIGRFVGEVKSKEKRQESLAKILIITNHKIFGKGIDVPDLDCIINFVQMSSSVNLEQIVGRLRNNPGHSHVFIDVTDNGFVECRNQLRTRKRFYKTIAKEIRVY